MLAEQDAYSNARFWLDVADKGLKFIALLVGAAWTWMHYVRGRTYKQKLELSTTGKLFQRNGQLYLSVVCRARNIGESKFPVQQEGTACEVWAFMGGPPKLVRTSRVFLEHKWFEPGSGFDDALFLRMPPVVDAGKLLALRVGLRVVSGGVEWNTNSIVELPDKDQILPARNPALVSSRKED